MSQSPPRRTQKGELSKIPSWIMLGFVAGALGMLSFERARERSAPKPPPERVAAPVPAPRPPSEAGARLPEIDAVFAVWADYALWENDLTEVALINSQTGDFTDYYEVIRFADRYFFRPIDRLTRPLVETAMRVDCPLRFTEPPAMRAARRAHDVPMPPSWLEVTPPPRPQPKLEVGPLAPTLPPAPEEKKAAPTP